VVVTDGAVPKVNDGVTVFEVTDETAVAEHPLTELSTVRIYKSTH